MGRHNVVSGILVLIVVLMIAISTFAVINYATTVLNAAVVFASTDQMAKLNACGITPPPEYFKLQADVPTLLLPAIYVGLPGLMIILSILMFIAGYCYGNEKEGRSTSETTITTSHPNRTRDSGRYEADKHVDETRTQKTTKSEGT
jgi:hypothetical protein